MKVELILRNTAFSTLVTLFSMFALSVIGFIFHIPVNIIYPIISFALGILVLFFNFRKSENFKQEFLISLFTYCSIFIISTLLGAKFYDSSWDGREYHCAAIILLKKGWNPIYDEIYNFASNIYSTKAYGLHWVENYPKFVEIIQANIFTIFKNIEVSKMTNFVFAFILLLYSYYVLSKSYFKEINHFSKFFISLVLILNPVYIAQFSTFYIDSYVYICFMLILFSIIDIETNEKFDYIPWTIFVINAISIVNVKLGGLLYLLVTTLIYFVYLKMLKQKQKILFLTKSVIIVLVALIISGINPYFTNISQDRHPLYPLAGENKKDIMTPNSPKEFVGSNYLKNLFVSTFSRVDNLVYESEGKTRLKTPFTVHRSEIRHLMASDTRICGFGVIWSGIVILSLILACFIRYNNSAEKNLFLLIFAILISLTLTNPYSWWARYATHLWTIPIFICIPILVKNKLIKTQQIVAFIILVLMLANSIIQITQSLKQERHFRKYTNNYINALKSENKPIKIFGIFDYSLCEKLKNKNVKFEFVSENYYEQNKSDFTKIPIAINFMYWDRLEK
ncbi:MAG: hypothetical protein E7Z89_08625 [Cyanobacteria bacterium SIG28]|nr:hypothetical protein [Cyanobacteria bacterium SIG28]